MVNYHRWSPVNGCDSETDLGIAIFKYGGIDEAFEGVTTGTIAVAYKLHDYGLRLLFQQFLFF